MCTQKLIFFLTFFFLLYLYISIISTEVPLPRRVSVWGAPFWLNCPFVPCRWQTFSSQLRLLSALWVAGGKLKSSSSPAFGVRFLSASFFYITSSAFGICLCRPAAVWRQKCFPILVWHPVSSLFMFGYYTDTCCCCMLVITNSFWDMRTVAFADVIGVWFGVNALVCVSFRHPLAKHWQLLFICCLLLLL